MQGDLPRLPFARPPLGFKPQGPMEWTGTLPAPTFLFDGGNTGWDDNARFVPGVLTGSPLSSMGPAGAAVSFNGINTALDYSSFSGEYAGSMTLVIVWSPSATGPYGLIEKRGSNAEFGINFQSGNYYQWFFSSGGSYKIANLGTGNIPAAGTWVTTCVVRSNGSYMAGWQNGALLVKDTSITSTPDSTTDNLRLGNYVGGSEWLNGDIALAYIIPTAVDDSVAAMLSVDPLYPLRPKGVFVGTSRIITLITLAQTTWNWTAAAVRINQKTKIPLATVTWAWNAFAVRINSKVFIRLSSVSWSWNAFPVSINQKTQKTLAQVSWLWSASAILPNQKTFLTLAQATWQWSAFAINYTQKTSITLAKVMWLWTASGIIPPGIQLVLHHISKRVRKYQDKDGSPIV